MKESAAYHAVIAAMLTVLRNESGNCLTPNDWMQQCYERYQVSYDDFVFMSPFLVEAGVVGTVRDGWQRIVKYQMTTEMARIDVEEPQSLRRNGPSYGFFCDER